jgi:hypothetical protein
MASSSSSASSTISFEFESSREPTPEYNPIAAYEILAPLHWDAGEWDFESRSEDDESPTDGKDLMLLLGAELEEDDEDDALWQNQPELYRLKYASPLQRAPTCFKRYNPLACRVAS